MIMSINEKSTSKNNTNSKANYDYSLGELIAADLKVWIRIWKPERASDESMPTIDAARLIFHYMGLRATLLYRVAHFLSIKRVKLLPGILTRLNIAQHGFDIPARVRIGPGLYVPHPVGTVITAERIGKNASLISCVTIGMRNTHEFPIIGDNVFIGAGARVLGDITIGDNVNIGANAVVLIDVPSGSTAVGVPAKVNLPQQ